MDKQGEAREAAKDSAVAPRNRGARRRQRRPGLQRPHRLGVSLDAAEYEAVKEAAALLGRTPVAFAADRVLEAAGVYDDEQMIGAASDAEVRELVRAVAVGLQVAEVEVRGIANNLNQAVRRWNASGDEPESMRRLAERAGEAVELVKAATVDAQAVLRGRRPR